ncbi:hypothetical protein TGMAS_249550 [Toxoplasma gondii MAS]|uniref:Uncharacterized protein n=1 Tax=Toxoplasma gondii MAS TaxID=943118 RepID=A0A086QDU8_TOXGO|nr:hypothetical protein TGMAS_249550 [Toxoplasma gondii MAS]
MKCTAAECRRGSVCLRGFRPASHDLVPLSRFSSVPPPPLFPCDLQEVPCRSYAFSASAVHASTPPGVELSELAEEDAGARMLAGEPREEAAMRGSSLGETSENPVPGETPDLGGATGQQSDSGKHASENAALPGPENGEAALAADVLDDANGPLDANDLRTQAESATADQFQTSGGSGLVSPPSRSSLRKKFAERLHSRHRKQEEARPAISPIYGSSPVSEVGDETTQQTGTRPSSMIASSFREARELKGPRSGIPRSNPTCQSRYASGESSLTTRVGGASIVAGSGPSESRNVSADSGWRSMSRWNKWSRKLASHAEDEPMPACRGVQSREQSDPEAVTAKPQRIGRPDCCWIAPKPLPEIPGVSTGPVYTVASGALTLKPAPVKRRPSSSLASGDSSSLASGIEEAPLKESFARAGPGREAPMPIGSRTASAPELCGFSSRPTLLGRVENTGWVRRITKRGFKIQRETVQGRKMPSVPELGRCANWESSKDDDQFEEWEEAREEEARMARAKTGAIRRPPHYTFTTAYTTQRRGRKIRGPFETPTKLREVKGHQIYPSRIPTFGVSTPTPTLFRTRSPSPDARTNNGTWKSLRTQMTAISLIGAAATDTSSPDDTTPDEFEEVTCSEDEVERNSSTSASGGREGSSMTLSLGGKLTKRLSMLSKSGSAVTLEKAESSVVVHGEKTENAHTEPVHALLRSDGSGVAEPLSEGPIRELTNSPSTQAYRRAFSAKKKWVKRPKVYTEEEEKQRTERRRRREERRACPYFIPAVPGTYPVARALLESLFLCRERLCLEQSRLALLDEFQVRELMFWHVISQRKVHLFSGLTLDCEGYQIQFLQGIETQLMAANDQDAQSPDTANVRTREFVDLIKMSYARTWPWENHVEEEVARCLREAEKKRRTELHQQGAKREKACLKPEDASVLTHDERHECEDACRGRLRREQEEEDSVSLTAWFTQPAETGSFTMEDASELATSSAFFSEAQFSQGRQSHRNLFVETGRALGRIIWGPLPSPSQRFDERTLWLTAETESAFPVSPSITSSSSAFPSCVSPHDGGDLAFSSSRHGSSAAHVDSASTLHRDTAWTSSGDSSAARLALKKAQKQERRELRKLMQMCGSLVGEDSLEGTGENQAVGGASGLQKPLGRAESRRRRRLRRRQRRAARAAKTSQAQGEAAHTLKNSALASSSAASVIDEPQMSESRRRSQSDTENKGDTEMGVAGHRAWEKWPDDADSEDIEDLNRCLKEVLQKLFREQRRLLRKQSERIKNSGSGPQDSRRVSESGAEDSEGDTGMASVQDEICRRKRELGRSEEERKRAGLVYRVASPLQPLLLLQDSNFWFDMRELAEEWRLSQRAPLFQIVKKIVNRLVQSAQKRAERKRRRENRVLAAALLAHTDLPFPESTLRLAPRFFFLGRPAAEIIVILSSLCVRRQAMFNSERLKNLMSCKGVIYYIVDANNAVADDKSPDMRLLRRWKRQRILRNAPHTHHGGILIPQVLVDGQSIGSYGEVQQLEDDGLLTAIFCRCRCPTCLQPRHVDDELCRWCNLQFRELLSVKRHDEGELKEMYRGHPTRAIPLLRSCFDQSISWILYPNFCSLCGAERRPDQPWCPQCHMTTRDIALARCLGIGIYRDEQCRKCGNSAGDALDCLERLPPQANPKFSEPPLTSYLTSKASPLCPHCGELLTYFMPVNEKIAEERREFGRSCTHRRRKAPCELLNDADNVNKQAEDTMSKQEQENVNKNEEMVPNKETEDAVNKIEDGTVKNRTYDLVSEKAQKTAKAASGSAKNDVVTRLDTVSPEGKLPAFEVRLESQD